VALDPVRIAALARADLLERSRRPAFLVLLGVGLWSAWVFTPPNHAAYATFRMAEARGAYGSAWIGCTVAMLTAVFFSLAGFYVVRNAIHGDRATGVGAILAATPMRNVEYTLAKWLSNTAMLGAMTVVMMVGAGVMQLVRAEDPAFRPLALVAPFVWVALPAMALTAALAVAFEAIPGLRGGSGNLVYFFFWVAVLLAPGAGLGGSSAWDPLGVHVLTSQMLAAGRAAIPEFGAHPESYSIGLNFRQGGWHLTTFPWAGMEWTPAIVMGRLGWLVAAALLAALAALPFDRFGDALAVRGPRRRRAGRAPESAEPEGAIPAAAAAVPATSVPRAAWASMAPAERGFGGIALVLAEARLLVAGISPWWWISWLALQLPGMLAPLEVAARFAAVAWIWPVLRWSALGARDRVHGTSALLDASPHPIARQLPASLAAGFALALAAGAGFGLRALAAGEIGTVAGWLVGALFVPALALALGSLTGGRKTFEIVYVVLWYVGPLNGAAVADFTGASGPGSTPGFAIATCALVALAAWRRARRIATG